MATYRIKFDFKFKRNNDFQKENMRIYELTTTIKKAISIRGRRTIFFIMKENINNRIDKTAEKCRER